MESLVSPLPEISISLAPPSEPSREPFSPFSTPPSSPGATEDDGYRPSLLSPPPAASPRFQRQLSPLCPDSVKNSGKGLEADRFQKLLASSKEHNTAINGKRAPDLRKEIAIKAHKTKQMERRALFLSKINERPSATATLEPKTPPESPAIFHYTLRSPGLESPLSMYEAVDGAEGVVTPWVEQVDFRREPEKKPRIPALPSLDQISARLSSHKFGPAIQQKPRVARAPFPAFLRSTSPPHDEKLERVPTARVPERIFQNQPPTPRPVLPAAPLATSPMAPTFADLMPPPPQRVRRTPSPLDPAAVRVTTTVVPRMSRTTSPDKLTEMNVALLTSRAQKGLNMMSAIRRRTDGPCSVHERPVAVVSATTYDERKARRISAPAELQARARDEFSHPVLALPGAF